MIPATEFMKRFQLSSPIVVAPMAGGPTTPNLVVASCEAGALGSVGGAYLSPEEIEKQCLEIRERTQRAFMINLFTPMPPVNLQTEQIQLATQSTRSYRSELGLADPILKPPYHPDFDQQFASVLKIRPAVFSFVFGLLSEKYLRECHALGIHTMGTATTLEEALALQSSGVDSIVLQGVEAGGHRGLFDANGEDPQIGIRDLLQAVRPKVKIPVIVTGGIMNGKAISELMQMGAQAVQLGTAFLLCDEAGTSPAYRKALSEKRSLTRLTRAFSGRWARGIENRFLVEMADSQKTILPFPAQNAFTRDLRNKSAQLGISDFLSLWAGAEFHQIRTGSAQSILESLCREAEKA